MTSLQRQNVYLTKRIHQYDPRGSEGRIFSTLTEALGFCDTLVSSVPPNSQVNIDLIVDSGLYVCDAAFGHLDFTNRPLNSTSVSLRILHHDFETGASNNQTSALLPARRVNHLFDEIQSASEAYRIAECQEAVFVFPERGIHSAATQLEIHGVVLIASASLAEPIFTNTCCDENGVAYERAVRTRCTWFYNESRSSIVASTSSPASSCASSTPPISPSTSISFDIPQEPMEDNVQSNEEPLSRAVLPEQGSGNFLASADSTPSICLPSQASTIVHPSITTFSEKVVQNESARLQKEKRQKNKKNKKNKNMTLAKPAGSIAVSGNFLAGETQPQSTRNALPLVSVATDDVMTETSNHATATTMESVVVNHAHNGGVPTRERKMTNAVGDVLIVDAIPGLQDALDKHKQQTRQIRERGSRKTRQSKKKARDGHAPWGISVLGQTANDKCRIIVNQCGFRCDGGPFTCAILIEPFDRLEGGVQWMRNQLFVTCIRESLFTGIGTIVLQHTFGASIDSNLAMHLQEECPFIDAICVQDLQLTQLTIHHCTNGIIVRSSPTCASQQIDVQYILCEDMCGDAIQMDADSFSIRNTHISNCHNGSGGIRISYTFADEFLDEEYGTDAADEYPRFSLQDVSLWSAILKVDDSFAKANCVLQQTNVITDGSSAVVFRKALVSGYKNIGSYRVSNTVTPSNTHAIYRVSVNELSPVDVDRLREQVRIWDDAPTVQQGDLSDWGFMIRTLQSVTPLSLYVSGYAIDKYGNEIGLSTITNVAQEFDSGGEPGWYVVERTGAIVSHSQVTEDPADRTRLRIDMNPTSSFVYFVAWVGAEKPLMGTGETVKQTHLVVDRIDFRGGGAIYMKDGQLVMEKVDGVPLRVFPPELPLSQHYAPLEGSSGCIACQ